MVDVMSYIKRFLYGKLLIGECLYPLFVDDKNAKKYFFEQYILKMDFTSNNGWIFKPNQKFNIDREIDQNGFQTYTLNKSAEEMGFFSGSTGWGWGIFKTEDMISYQIAKGLGVNIINYSQVAYNLSKIYHQIIDLKLKQKLPKKNIIYFGINEAYPLAYNSSLFSNPRDIRVNRAIKYFEQYYYNMPMNYLQILQTIARRIKFDINQIKNYISSNISSKEQIKLDDELYAKNIKDLFNLIQAINNLGEFTFVLEPSIFHKKYLTGYEQIIISTYDKTPLKFVFEDLYQKIRNFCQESKIEFIDSSDCITFDNDGYWDYCHPSSKITHAINKKITEEILHAKK